MKIDRFPIHLNRHTWSFYDCAVIQGFTTLDLKLQTVVTFKRISMSLELILLRN